VSFESGLYRYLADQAAVQALIGQGGSPADVKLYPLRADAGIRLPYAVYQRVGGASTGDLSGPTIANSRLQLDAYGKNADDAIALAAALNDALDGVAVVFPGLGRCVFTRVSIADMNEAETRLYRRMQEYSVWHPE
jgi:Protein of unknown function (DUF3168)